MTPLIFGPSGRQLFGVLNAPAHATSAVLMCPPVGQELLRAYRFHRVLADRLLRAGVATLRFDYHGTGDSAGDDSDGDLEGWAGDVHAAHAELRSQVGPVPITWYGPRLGGTVAALAATQRSDARPTPDRLVVWDPVLDGSAWLRELCREHLSVMEDMYCVPPRDLRSRLAADPEAFAEGPLGFELSVTLREQLHQLGPEPVSLPRGCPSTVICSPAHQATLEWVQRQASGGASVEPVLLDHALIWFADAVPGNALVPAEGLQVLLKHLRAHGPSSPSRAMERSDD